MLYCLSDYVVADADDNILYFDNAITWNGMEWISAF